MARPKKSITRDCWLPKTRATHAEHAAVEARRAASGLSMSEFLRQQALEGAVIQRKPLADKRLLSELAAIGNNLNQIARKANMTDHIDNPVMDRVREMLCHLDDLLDELIGEC